MKSFCNRQLSKLAIAGTCALWSAQATAVAVMPATEGQLGLESAARFRFIGGKCSDCPTPPAALWYFRDDVVVVPKGGMTGFERRLRPQEDVRVWATERNGKPEGSSPPLVWIGSPAVARGTLSVQGNALTGTERELLSLTLVPRIEANRSYFDANSVKYFAGRRLSARGRLDGDGRFVARTLWPEDFRLGSGLLSPQPLRSNESLTDLVRAESGGADKPMVSRVLWSRSGEPVELAGKPVMAFVLNGAQGDDDEAHGGHFAVTTGRFGPQGEWDNWLVNNFYNLDSVSEKGIIAAALPMDAYQGDLNSGQSWYRPSYMLVAVFKDGRVPALYQEAIGRVFNHFYRHDFRYNHATANCTGINIETLRSLGWNIPKQGPGDRLKAAVALPYMAIKELSLESGRKAYDYLATEVTNLYPFVGFVAAGEDLLGRIAKKSSPMTPFEQAMASDIEALVYVRIPQFPSSRAMGQAPVASLDEYMARAPADRSKWQIVPVPPRPFPHELRDGETIDEDTPPSGYALAGYAGFLSMLGVGGWKVRRRRTVRSRGRGHHK